MLCLCYACRKHSYKRPETPEKRRSPTPQGKLASDVKLPIVRTLTEVGEMIMLHVCQYLFIGYLFAQSSSMFMKEVVRVFDYEIAIK